LLIIKGGKALTWKIKVSGSKNAALPILWAALLLKGKVRLKWMPNIWDVNTFLDIMSNIWVKYKFIGDTLEFDSSNISKDNLDLEKIKKIRASIFLLSPLLYFFWNISIPFPWGCNIWKRPIDAHLNWLQAIGYDYKIDDEEIILEWKLESWDKTINAWFWVSSTENLIVANVLRKWVTTIELAGIEPHVMNLVDFLRAAGADIKIRYNHTIIVTWVKELRDDFEFNIISDYIQSWTYMVLGALAAEKYIDIENARIQDLYAFIEKLKDAWVQVENLWNDTLRVFKSERLKTVSIQTNIFPGFPTDLQSPFAVLMTQAKWTNKVHEILFEGRLNFLVELEKMQANVALLNPHEALIFGPSPLKWGVSVTSWDLRAWAAMVIAWLIAEWTTKVTKVEYIHRGYENFVENLQSLWADIEEV